MPRTSKPTTKRGPAKRVVRRRRKPSLQEQLTALATGVLAVAEHLDRLEAKLDRLEVGKALGDNAQALDSARAFKTAIERQPRDGREHVPTEGKDLQRDA